MKKLILSVLLAVGFTASVFAAQEQFKVPLDVNNVPDNSLRVAGVEKCVTVFSTTPILAVDRSSLTITSGLLYWIVRPSTAGIGQYLEFRDTNTANVTSLRLLPRIPAVSTATAAGITTGQVIYFDPPIPFDNGLSYNLTPAGVAPSTEDNWSFGVRWKRR